MKMRVYTPSVAEIMIHQYNVLIMNLEDKLNLLDPHEIGHAMLIEDEISECRAAIAALAVR